MIYQTELKDVCVTIHGKTILENVSFGIKKGEFVTVLGPNGSGKTTMLKAVLGIIRPVSGEVRVCGFDAVTNSDEARKRVSYIPQGMDIDRFFPITAGDVISCGIISGFGIKKSNGAGIKQAVEEMGVSRLLKQPFGTLSGGEKQKIMLAAALARNPEAVFLDEPNLNLDPFAYEALLNAFMRINRERGISIVFVTHLMDKIPPACKRIIVMKNGRIVSDESAENTLARGKIGEFIYG
ncbi:MAG TPA: ATP-binding cassette domain-containing protein [Firmicutes bacterium]|nr:ATP-binding cassette domain-containing protein [Bacillota bacterium]